jgi:hypothetical protein
LPDLAEALLSLIAESTFHMGQLSSTLYWRSTRTY